MGIETLGGEEGQTFDSKFDGKITTTIDKSLFAST
jgi:hypothetical protein